MLKNRWLGLVLALLLAVTTACGSDANDEDAGAAESEAAASVEVPEVPEVVAEVNGDEISREAFADAYEARARQSAAAQGEPDADQLTDEVVQSLVNEVLLKQEADRRDIQASEEQVEATLTELAEQNQMTAEQLRAALEDQGLTSEDVDRQATQQTRFDLLVADETGPVEATDQEIRALYRQAKQQQEQMGGENAQPLPPLQEIRPQLRQQVVQQEKAEAGRTLIDRLRKKADITVNV